MNRTIKLVGIICVATVAIWSAFVRQESYWWDEDLAEPNDEAIAFLRLISLGIFFVCSLYFRSYRRNGLIVNIIAAACLVYATFRFLGTF